MLCTTQIPFLKIKLLFILKRKFSFQSVSFIYRFFKIVIILVRTSDFETIRPGPIPGGCVTNFYLFFHVLFS